MLRRFGRPGLIGLATRTAVVAGTATAVAGGVARRQQRRAQTEYEAAQYEAARQVVEAAPQPATRSASADTGDLVAQLQELAALKSSGVLSDAEFEAAKAKLLAS